MNLLLSFSISNMVVVANRIHETTSCLKSLIQNKKNKDLLLIVEMK